MQRKVLPLIVTLILALLAASASAAPATVYTVDTTTDEADGSCSDGDCSLRDAINLAVGGDTIQFALALPATITLTLGELPISQSITIVGPGPDQLTVSGNHASRVFTVWWCGPLSLSGMTIADGTSDSGAGFRAPDHAKAQLTLTDIHFRDNEATYGGGALLVGEENTVNLTHAVLENNRARYGGGMYLDYASGTATDVTFRDNTAGDFGGGIFLQYFSLVMNTVSFIDNRADTGMGGAMLLWEHSYAGLTNATLSGNSASFGGAITVRDGSTVDLDHVTIAGNQAGTGNAAVQESAHWYACAVNFKNTVIAGNEPANCGPVWAYDQGYNLDSGRTCGLAGTGSFSDAQANLAPVGDYGGSTWTHALLSGSQAVDAIPNGESGCGSAALTDQRGEPRPENAGGPCDMGAFERELWPGTIVVEKETMPAGATGLFDFSASYTNPFSLAGGESRRAPDLPRGPHAVTETVSPGWDLASIACSDGSPADPDAGTASIDLGAGETVTCTFTNWRQGICVPPPEGLLGWWQGEGDATDNADGHDGTWHGGEAYAAGKVHQAFNFDGVDDRVDVGSLGVNTDDMPFTIAAWIKPNAATVTAGTHVIVSNGGFTQGQAGTHGRFAVDFGVGDMGYGGEPADRVWFMIGAEQVWGAWKRTGLGVAADQWAFVAATYDATQTLAGMKLYINGVEQATIDNGSGFDWFYPYDDWHIGSELGFMAPANHFFGGGIDEVQIVNRVLTPEEIMAEYQAGSAGKCQGGTIVVEKQTDPDGSTEMFDFAASYTDPFSLGDGGTKEAADLAPGPYAVTETVPPGWDLTSVVCVDATGNSTGNLPAGTATIDLAAGETVTCTYTNTLLGKIVVAKETAPDGMTDLFGFTASYTEPFSLADGGSKATADLLPGLHTVTETVPPGWDLTLVLCSDQSPGDPDSGVASIDLAAGETVTCTFMNEALPGKIVVAKEAEPPVATLQWEFTGDAAGTIGHGGQIVVDSLPAGTYTSTEILPSTCPQPRPVLCPTLIGLTSTCVGCSSEPLPEMAFLGPSAQLQAGQFYFIKGPTAALETLAPLWQAPFEPSNWSIALVQPAAPTAWNLAGSIVWRFEGQGRPRLPFVLHSLLDQPPDVATIGVVDAGWMISVQAIDHLNYLYQGTPREAYLYLIPEDGSPEVVLGQVAIAEPARLTVTVRQRGTVEIRTQDSSAWWVQCQPPPCQPWELSAITCEDPTHNSSGDVISQTATFAVGPGETVTCTFANTQQGKIVIEKQTLPDGEAAVFDFSGDISGQAWDGWQLVAVEPPGVYSTRELAPDGWHLTSVVCEDNIGGDSTGNPDSGIASIDLAAGETVTCTFSNEKINPNLGRILVVKQTLPDGDLQTFEFTGDAAGTIGDDQAIAVYNLAPGTYTATEIVPTGWKLQSIVCQDPSGDSSRNLATKTATFNVAAGEEVRCTFTNKKMVGTIIVVKQTLPDGDPQTFTFSGKAAGTIGDGQQIVVDNLAPGTYTATEVAPAGWKLTGISCQDPTGNSAGSLAYRKATFRVAAGETVKCTFTNTRLGTIVVRKQTVPSGSLTKFAFSGAVTGRIADGGQLQKLNVKPGTYNAVETVPAGWAVTGIECVDPTGDSYGNLALRKAFFLIGPGETVTCTFTNNKR